MSKIKSLIDYDVKENIDNSAICIKFAMMSKQIENKDKEIEFHKNNERIAIDCQNKLSEEIERLNNIINKIVNIYESKDTTEDVYFALEELFEKENIKKKK